MMSAEEQPSQEVQKRFVAAFGFEPTAERHSVTRTIEQEIVMRVVAGFRDSLGYHLQELQKLVNNAFPSSDLLELRGRVEGQEIAIAHERAVVRDLECLANAYGFRTSTL